MRADLFKQYQPMMTWLANHFAEKFSLPVGELICEAESALSILLVRDWERFDPKKAKATTYIYHSVFWRLQTYCERESWRNRGRVSMVEADEDCEGFDPPYEQSWIERMWSELGNEGRALLRVIFEAPGPLGDVLWVCRNRGGKIRYRTRKSDPSHKRYLLEYLREVEKWPEERISEGWKQVRECCA